ncbi:hypothetical protein PA01_15460 [Azoarcus sp. PA01]|nr:hypothetical protein PA01_15460 [Azoarcus sp. PA01]
MKRTAFFVLMVINGALLVAIAILWAGADSDWTPPAALPPEPASLAAERIEARDSELAALEESAKRPLFSATRRPSDELADNDGPTGAFDPVVLGLFERAGGGKGAIVRIDDKVHRLSVGDGLGSWVLDAIDAQGAAVFKRDDERLAVQLLHLPQPAPSPAAAAERAAPGRAAASSAGGIRPVPSTDSRSPARGRAERRSRAGLDND